MRNENITQKLLGLSQIKFNALVKFCRQNNFFELSSDLDEIKAKRDSLIKRTVDLNAEDLSYCSADCFLKVLARIFNNTEDQCLEKFDKTKLFDNPEDIFYTDSKKRILGGNRGAIHYNLKYLTEQMDRLLKEGGYNILELSDTVPVKLLKENCVFLEEGRQGPASHYVMMPLSSYGSRYNVTRIYIKNID